MPFDLSEESDDTHGNFFFWLVKKRQSPTQSLMGDNGNNKLIVWLNGGPGCSSMVGMMWENGPFGLQEASVGDGYKFPTNDFSWNEAGNVLYVEQPVRTGFSLAANNSRIVKSEKEVSEDFYSFLISFLKVFTELSDAKVFISGESYAGSYIPSIAQYIVKKQLHFTKSRDVPFIDLDGIAIGNGVIDDAIQSASYTEYAYAHGLIPLAAKQLIDDKLARCLENAASHVNSHDPNDGRS